MRRIWIMAGADGVDVMLFHEEQILHDLLLADDKSGHRVAVMAIYAVELHLLPVDIENISFHMNLPEADVAGDHFPGAVALCLINHRVKVRIFRVPEMRIRHFHMERPVLRPLLCHQITVSVQKATGDRNYLIEEVECDSNLTCITLFTRHCLYKIIKDPLLWPQQKIHIPEDTAHTEFILGFQITAVTPFEHEDCQHIFSVAQILADMKLAGGMGHLAVADKPAV